MTIRFLRYSEIKKLKLFINNHYKKNHILSINDNVIKFFYNYRSQKKLNILGIFEKEKLKAILGFIPLNNWDKNLKKDIFLALMFKSKKYKKDIIFNFLNKIYKNLKPNFLAVSGFNDFIADIYSRIGSVHKFNHYYILNPKCKPKVSSNLYTSKKKNKIDNLELSITKNIQKLPISKSYPKKTKKYFVNKYLTNPFYDYFILNFYENKKLAFFFICRKIKISEFKSNIYRIVDFYGEIKDKFYIYNNISKTLIKNKIEYVDFLCFGFKENILINLGFFKKNKKQIIPNFFEPFIKKNDKTKICILRNNYQKNLIICKGDGDQERPNKIKIKI